MPSGAAPGAHWLGLGADELAFYDRLFAWDPSSAPLYAPADIRTGQQVADFGCGPGHMAVELARWVGPDGHVHALDVSPAFIALARDKITAGGLDGRITAHLLDGPGLPLAAASLDRIVARNTLIYVDDPLATMREFRRVLRPGGKAHAIEGDWQFMLAEPLPLADWSALIDAASGAARTPQIGRRLYGIARQAGFSEVAVAVVARPDTTGRLRGMIGNLAGYARQGGGLGEAAVDDLLQAVDRAIADGSFFALAPQFLVTATV